ncbi:MAG: hypothetical protein IJU62_06845 [Muribaculaceae bacterium]|nr:hypothetical protein [Muribaculaceae bacterium]
MKYRDIIHFEPITEVIQFNRLDEPDYRRDVLRNFVYPDYFLETVIPQIVNNLKFDGRDKRGVQIVGNYGTGKSHLMSLILLVAENAVNLLEIQNERAREILEPIAGRFLTHRFELGNDKDLWSLVTYQLQRFLDQHDIDYHFDPASLKMYDEQLGEMMSAFEDKYPDKGFLLVIDEMLSYLRNRAENGNVNGDLPVLQALGQQCSRGHFGFIFGVQELIYSDPSLAFAAQMLLRVKDRHCDLTIRREDVSFVVENRLLGKNDEQKALVRQHLQRFVHLFPDMHGHLQDYVDLFPVHPSYFHNFQRIRHGQSQRQVLKTISQQFELIKDNEIPDDNPGLITYDRYWETIMGTSALMAIPEIKKVAETVTTVHDKIEANFDGARAKQKPLARRIVNAVAVKILQGDLNMANGARAATLADDLCYTTPLATDSEMLVSIIDACARNIIKATSGQFFDQKPDNGEYHLRTEGGINYDQLIAQFADQMSDAQRDEAFFRFLVDALEIDDHPFRTGFRIYQHELEWRSHKIKRDGYIFFGDPSEKSTTQPKQFFYLIFMPIFQESKKHRNCEQDEVYFVMDGVSEEFKDFVCRYGAAFSLLNSADQSQKMNYRGKMETLYQKARTAFDACYLEHTLVYYGDSDGRKLRSFRLPGEGSRRIDNIDAVASEIFEDVFTAQAPQYPVFSRVRQVITHDNRERYIKGAIAKLIQPQSANLDGEAVLEALGCYAAGEINPDHSIYAQTALGKLAEKGDTMVLNRDELLVMTPPAHENIWRSRDYGLDADFEFLVLAALVHNGDIEITLQNGNRLNGSNPELLRNLTADDFFNFSHIARPRGLNIPAIKLLSKMLLGRDLSTRLADDDRDAFAQLVNAGKKLAEDVVTFAGRELRGPVVIGGVEIYGDSEASMLSHEMSSLRGFGDKVKTYGRRTRLKNLEWDVDGLKHIATYIDHYNDAALKIKAARDLDSQVSYLRQARQYVPAGHPLMADIDGAVDAFATVIAIPEPTAVDAYQQQLQQVKDAYINFYLQRYRGYCINDIENQERTRLLNSPQFAVCRKLSQLPLLSQTEWTRLREDVYKLKPANPNAETMMQSSPYIDFNPATQTATPRTVHDLWQDLDDLYNRWIDTLRNFCMAPEQQESLRMLDAGGQNFLHRFINRMEPIDNEHAAECLLELFNQLSDGYDAVEISTDSLRCFFDRPLTIEQARDAFDSYLQQLSRGKRLNRVRIILN